MRNPRTNSQPRFPNKESPRGQVPPLTYSRTGPHGLDRLEESLDVQEINLQNYHITGPREPQREVQIYTEFLQKVGYYLKQRDARLGTCLQRGLRGLSKALGRDGALPVAARAQAVQTERLSLDGSYDLAELKSKIRDAQFTDITAYLRCVHEDLQRMRTEVPDLTETPGEPCFQLDSLTKTLTTTFQQLAPRLKSTVESAVQTINEPLVQNEGAVRWEFARTSEVRKVPVADKAILAQPRDSLQTGTDQSAEKNKEREALEEELQWAEEARLTAEEQLGRKNHDVKLMKTTLLALHSANLNKVQQLDYVEGELFDAQAKALVLEAKLKQLEAAWTEAYGQPAEYKRVEPGRLIKQADLKRLDFRGLFKNEVRGKPLKQLNKDLASSSDEICLDELQNDLPLIRRSHLLKHPQRFKRSLFKEAEPATQEKGTQALKPLQTTAECQAEHLLESPFLTDFPNEAGTPPSRTSLSHASMEPPASTRIAEGECPDFSQYDLACDSVSALTVLATELTKSLGYWESKMNTDPLYTSIKTGQATLEKLTQRIAVLSQSKLTQTPSAHPRSFSKPHTSLRIPPRSARKPTSASSSPVTSSQKDTLTALTGIPELLELFNNDQELENLPQQLRIELLRAMKGHAARTCGDGVCEHLRRAMAIRAKSRGVPYPIKQATLFMK